MKQMNSFGNTGIADGAVGLEDRRMTQQILDELREATNDSYIIASEVREASLEEGIEKGIVKAYKLVFMVTRDREQTLDAIASEYPSYSKQQIEEILRRNSYV